MKAETTEVEAYLRSTKVVDSDHPEIVRKSHELASRGEDEAAKVKTLFEWVRDAIPHSRDIGSKKVTCRASEVLSAGTGICFAKSHLLAALCRSSGIPAGFCYQVFVRQPPYEGQGLHGLNAVYLSSHAKWIRLDARGNTGDIDAQFSVDEEKLAFPVDPSAGELFIHDTIYCEPDPGVVSYLSENSDLDAAWGDLPEAMVDRG